MKYKWKVNRWGEWVLGSYKLGFEVIVYPNASQGTWGIQVNDESPMINVSFEKAISLGEKKLDKLLDKVVKDD